MKKFVKNLIYFSVSLILSFSLFSCGENENDKGTSHVSVSLTDSPGDYDEVNIEVIDVKIKMSDVDEEDGWLSIGNITPGIFNLLDLTGGVTQILADNDIPSGHIGQIRLILGENNTVVKEGVSYPLHTPSAQQSGLKLNLNQTLLPDINYHFLIDFDVDKSIVVEAGKSGNYNLHPVLRVTSEAVSGSIKGIANAGEYQVLASVMVNDVEVNAYADESGVFQLHGIPSGTYTVTLTPDPLSGLLPKTVENVKVINGEVTDIGEQIF